MKSTLKVGHRGAKGYISENTLPSIQKALDLNVDGIEIDVHLCAFGELVVFHDFTLDRMTNGTGEIGKQTLSQLQNLLVDGKYKIPMLTEVLDLIKAKCLLNIELKGEKTALPTVKLLHQYFDKGTWTYNDILISSFQRKELEAVYNFDKKIAELKDIKIDNKINQSVNKILNNVVFKNKDLQNKIYFKNLLNDAIKNYSG